MFSIKQKVIFVLGKGGVGRTMVSTLLGYHFALQGLKSLIVQWSLNDVVSPIFLKEPVGHKHKEILPNLYVMNYDSEITLKEYFVDHLHMNLFYKFIIENPQVKKLLQATPGLEEIFFLGRIFWLSELAKEERGYEFDKIIIDAPATGHGSALFGVISTISKFKLEGPLISETTRVAKMLEDSNKVATVVVTLPEELPFEETIELIDLINREMRRLPIYIFINKSFSFFIPEFLYDDLNFEEDVEYKEIFYSIYLDIKNKLIYENKIRNEYKDKISVVALPDLSLYNPYMNSLEKIQYLAPYLENYEY